MVTLYFTALYKNKCCIILFRFAVLT